MKRVYELLLSLPSIGPFTAYQYAVDLNYSTISDFSENEFVQPGPGALNGLAKCFSSLGDYSPADAIRWVTERQDSEFEARGLAFKSRNTGPPATLTVRISSAKSTSTLV